MKHRPVQSRQVDAALICLVTLHDLGKISHSFRAMLRDGRSQSFRHWEHSGALLGEHADLLGRKLNAAPEVLRVLCEAVAGHHGGPRISPDWQDRTRQSDEIGSQAHALIPQVIEWVTDLFPTASLSELSEQQANALSWKLNGLTIQSDWIGSNPEWFPPVSPVVPLGRYWADAQEKAVVAVTAAGLHRARVADRDPRGVLPEAARLHPMQQAVLNCSLPDGPMLSIIEDATGAGKTEAALMLAARMMQAGKARGCFFALPTMATANAMLPRLEAAADVFFDAAPSLALSHGRADLSAQFRDIRGRAVSNPESGPHCGPWLSDGRRKSLLADLGVGTLDQALLGVLPTRFNGLRLWALADRVLIVDEAHSYDPYMQAQLERLLKMQASLGGSAIVLTATLPSPKKRAFEAAFQSGLHGKPRRAGGRGMPLSQDAPAPYPALSTVASGRALTAVNPAPETVRTVKVARIGAAEHAVGLIAEAAQRGAACIWVRNAVDDAIAAVDLLQAAGIRADLLHARFALCDRLHHEDRLQARFGKDGQGRAGQVLVATQVAEQSLDLDFDVMVSDIAPIGSLIQRAGRLWRHMAIRPAATRPVSGPCLTVLSPDPDAEVSDRWLHDVLDRGAYVYDPTVVWRSARVLFDAGQIAAPDGVRALIEAVEGDDPQPLPPGLQDAEFRHEGQDLIERQMARNILTEPGQAFDQDAMQKVWDDEAFPTRLGVPQVPLVLAVRSTDGLIPWAGDGPADPLSDRWALSEVQIPLTRFDADLLDQSTPDIAAIKQHWTEARQAHTWIAPVAEDGSICDGLRYDARLGMVFQSTASK